MKKAKYHGTEPEYMECPNPTEPELLLPKLVNRCKAKTIYPVIALLYFMAKFVEMDDRTKFKDQTEEKNRRSINSSRYG